jgi:hypothetical protein
MRGFLSGLIYRNNEPYRAVYRSRATQVCRRYSDSPLLAAPARSEATTDCRSVENAIGVYAAKVPWCVPCANSKNLVLMRLSSGLFLALS